MRDVWIRVFGWAVALGVAAVMPAWLGGWGVAISLVAVLGAAALLAGDIARRYVRPLQQLGEVMPTGVSSTSAAELARAAAAEYRDAVERLRDASQQSRRREAVLAHTTDAALIIDPSGLVEYANPTARAFLHDRILDVTRRLQQPDLDRLVSQARRSGETIAEDVNLWVPAAKPARARAVPLADGATILLLSDLSESYRLDRVRRDFVANVSHELKTPVAAIRALAETAATALSSDDLDTAVRFVGRLGTEAIRLGDLISDLLDLSRVEVGGNLELASVEFAGLIHNAAELNRAVAEVKGIDLVVDEAAGGIVEADASQISMAIKNLIDNAVRYSESGTVTVSTAQRSGYIAVTVSDEGIGIPTDEIPRIFERFYRVDKARSRATGGTGLGLAIVRHVAENHGGRIEVTSELGAGSTFTLHIPIAGPSREGSAA